MIPTNATHYLVNFGRYVEYYQVVNGDVYLMKNTSGFLELHYLHWTKSDVMLITQEMRDKGEVDL